MWQHGKNNQELAMAQVNSKCNSPNIHCLDSVAIISSGGRWAKINGPRTRFHIVDNSK